MNNIITRDYNGQVFQFRADGYFNMTKAAQAFGKDLQVFMRRDDTVEYVDALSQTVPDTDCPIVQAYRGGRTPGTWGHPKLAVFFARWLDVKFAVFCDMVIDDILNKKAEVTFTPEATAPKLAKTHLDTARELVAVLEESARLEQENAILLPKAEGYDAFVSKEGLYSSTQVAQMLGFQGAIAVNRVLRHIGWKSRRDADAPNKKAVDKGWLVVRMRLRAGSYRSFPEVFVTPKGFDELRRIIGGSAIEVA